MDRKVIKKISKILKEEIKKRIKDIQDTNEQNAEIYDVLESYMPYIDKENSQYCIEIIKENNITTIRFRVDEKFYLIIF